MTYMFDWVGPRAPEAWDRVPLRTPEPYGDHLRPLYNLHQDGACAPDPNATDPATDPASVPADGDWRGLWLALAAWETDGSHLQALPDMLAGHHSAVVHELVTTQVTQRGLTMAAAESLAIVEFCVS